MALSYEQALNQVAQQYGHKSWAKLLNSCINYPDPKCIDSVAKEAAELYLQSNRVEYGKQCWNNGAKAMKKDCMESYSNTDPDSEYHPFANVSIPEFKA